MDSEAATRMQCLEYAVKALGGTGTQADEIVKAAQAFYDFASTAAAKQREPSKP